jgi:hypothetical protein
MMIKPKVYILVVCAHKANKGEYDLLTDTIKETWGRTETENAKIFYLWCNNYKKKDENDWVLNKPESYGALLLKTLGFLHEHIDDDFDYIFRTNAGSYVHTERLVEWLQDCPREQFYAGAGGNCAGIDFASGSGFILSKDLVQLAVKNRSTFGKDHIDDVSFGRFMARHGVKRSQQFMRITNHGGGLILQKDDEVCPEPQFDYDKNYHWRLRANDGQRQYDCATMWELYKQFNL